MRFEQDSSATQVTDIHECALHVQSASEGPDRPAQSAFQSQSLSLSWLQYSGIQSCAGSCSKFWLTTLRFHSQQNGRASSTVALHACRHGCRRCSSCT